MTRRVKYRYVRGYGGYGGRIIPHQWIHMDEDSPFAHFQKNEEIKPTRVMHVNYCAACHHVWKAPATTKKCINCKGNGDTVISLINYVTGLPVL